MNQLHQHIERLLLTNDCVIVPSLGGFVAHHICARYVEEEGLFLPPLRTLGFNPQLTLNDSLLAQSYAEAFDVSLPEALDMIEQEVSALRQTLDEQGEVELYDLGRLYKNAEGQMAFTPCEAGILTPSLYALSSFELRQLQTKAAGATAAEQKQQTEAATVEPEQPQEEKTRIVCIGSDKGGHKTLNISLKALRNTGIAAAVLAAAFLIPFSVGTPGTVKESSMLGSVTALEQLTQPSPTPAASAPEKKAESKASAPKQTSATVEAPATPHWSIVLCSHVSHEGAQYFVKQLADKGFKGAEISTATGSTKVLYGHYATAAEAQTALNTLIENQQFQQGWVMEVKK